MSLALRKDATMTVGGFNDELQIYEDKDVILRLQRAGFKYVRDKTLAVLHREAGERFSLTGHLKRTLSYGYWWHMYSYLHPEATGTSAYPLRLFGASLFIVISFFFQMLIPLVLLLPLLWLGFQMWVDRRTVLPVISLMKSARTRLSTIVVISILYLLGAILIDAGKFSAMLDKLQGKMNRKMR